MYDASRITILSQYFHAKEPERFGMSKSNEQQDLYKWTWQSRESYALKHGYRLVDAAKKYALIHAFIDVDPRKFQRFAIWKVLAKLDTAPVGH